MADEEVNDGMIEIGDPETEPIAPEPPPKVVIEYRERGVPWMLIPPLLVIAALGAVLVFKKLVPEQRRPPVPSVAVAPVVPDVLPSPDKPLADKPFIQPVPPPVELEKPKDPVTPPVVEAARPAPPVVVPPPGQAEPNPTPAPAPDPIPEASKFPKAQGVGFDPKAFEAERKPDAPPDPSLAPASQDGLSQVPEQVPNRAVVPEEREKPREMDPELLPPDPRQARARQAQRRLEALQEVEVERANFHRDLKRICQKYREISAPAIVELVKQYETRVDPMMKQKAIELLGKTGQYAGADRGTRIELLRSLGFPEPVILDNLFLAYERNKINERGGPKDSDEAYYHSALILLKYPPSQPKSSSRSVSTPSPGSNAGGASISPPR